MKASTPSPVRYWIFQGKPERYELKEKLIASKKEDWVVTRYKNDIKPADIVIFWRSGDDEVLYGWGEVIGEVTNLQEKESRVAIQYLNRFRNPIKLSAIEGHKELFGLTIRRNSQGTNFRVTRLEVKALNEIIANQKEVQVPLEAIESTINDIALHEYRYSSSVTQILNTFLIDRTQQQEPPNCVTLLTSFYNLAEIRAAERETFKFVREALDRYGFGKAFKRPKQKGSTLEVFKEFVRPELQDEFMGDDVDISVVKLISEARGIAIKTTSHERVNLRHFFAAFLTQAEAFGLQELYDGLSLNMDGLRSDFLNFIRSSFASKEEIPWDNMFAWENILTGQNQPALDISDLLTQVNADDTDGKDLLNITPEVNAFASIIASSDLNPPLAIGLFGDWGSGKTFFMERMSDRVKAIADKARMVAQDKQTRFHGNIVQIWFNAWHYMDSNLWASLVDHIFKELERNVNQLQEEERLDEDPFKSFTISKEEEKAAEKRLRVAIVCRHKAKKKLESLQSDKKQFMAAVEKEQKKKSLDMTLADTSFVRQQLNTLLPKLETLFGVKTETQHAETAKTAREVMNIMSSTSMLANRAHNLWRSIMVDSPPLKTKILLWIIAIIGLGLIVFAVVEKASSGILATVIAQIGAAIGVALPWIKKRIAEASQALDIAENINTDLNARIEEEEVKRKEAILSLENKIKNTTDELVAADQQLVEAEEKLRQLQAERRELTTAERMANFIDQRARSDSYSKHLGLVNMIRKDFKILSDLMLQQNSEQNAGSELDAQTAGDKKINRIVLYIDDLDRCPQDKVVEVLQAVHLLLAFKLFIVVVGVDARWVSRSLKESHPHLLYQDNDDPAEPVNDQTSAVSGTATTQDYLEKIFQVPFWLKPLDMDKVSDLIDGIIDLGGEVASGDDEQDEGQSDMPEKGEGTGAKPSDEKGEESTEDEEEGAEHREINLNPQSLSITTSEVEYMRALGDIAGRSPRAIKRFINVYRLLKASIPEAAQGRFTSEHGEFKSYLLLLAILTGRPSSAPLFIEMVSKEGNNTTSKTFINKLKKHETMDNKWVRFCALLEAFNQSKTSRISIEQLKKCIPQAVRFSFQHWRV
ncbi:MAG: P-loop NTPase fold protein [Bacteroidota bacterium]